MNRLGRGRVPRLPPRPMESDMGMEAANEADDRVYRGLRDGEGNCHVRVMAAGAVVGRPLPPRLDLANKSPSGFEWGYGGSGPAQLALALCADALDDGEAALRVFQRFKFRVVGRLPRDEPWTLTAAGVRRHCRESAVEEEAGRDEP